MRTHRHHLLEIILWPNGNSTFRTILNSAKRLKELGIYDDWKMTIPISDAEHRKLHSKYMTEEDKLKQVAAMNSEHIKRRLSATHKGDRNPLFGKHHSEETKRKMAAAKKGELNPLFGKPRSEETRRKISESLKARRSKNK